VLLLKCLLLGRKSLHLQLHNASGCLVQLLSMMISGVFTQLRQLAKTLHACGPTGGLAVEGTLAVLHLCCSIMVSPGHAEEHSQLTLSVACTYSQVPQNREQLSHFPEPLGNGATTTHVGHRACKHAVNGCLRPQVPPPYRCHRITMQMICMMISVCRSADPKWSY